MPARCRETAFPRPRGSGRRLGTPFLTRLQPRAGAQAPTVGGWGPASLPVLRDRTPRPRTRSEQTLWPSPPLPPSLCPGLLMPRVGAGPRLSQPQEERGRAPAGHPLPFPTVHALLHAPDTPEMAPRPCCPAPSSGSQTLGPGHTTRSVEARAPAEGTPCPRAWLPSVRMGRRVTGVIKTRLASTGRCGPAQGRAPGSATPRPTHRPPVPLAGCIIQVGSWCRGVWEAPRSSLTRGRHPVCSRQVRSGLGRACWLAPSWSRHPFPAGRGLPYGSSALGLPGEAGMGTQAP